MLDSRWIRVLSGLGAAFCLPSPVWGQLGAAITDPEPLNTSAAADSSGDYSCRVATDGAGHWVAVWWSGHDLGGTIGTDWDILVSRSADNGASWSAPAALNTNAGSDSGKDMRPALTTDGLGNWLAVWSSDENLGGTVGTDSDILTARSTDNGATWSIPQPLNTNAGSDSGPDANPQVTTDALGNWVAVWYSSENLGGSIGVDRDVLLARSVDNGTTWSAPQALNTNAASDSGDDQYPQATTDGSGNWLVVWRSDENLGGTIGTDVDVLIARSTDNGATWSAPEPLNSNADSDTGSDYEPEVTTDGVGNWVAVWTSKDDLGGTIGTDYDNLVARSTDNGTTWSAPQVLNANANWDSGGDEYPHLATDGSGNWVAVWESNDVLDGTIGGDYDILVARFALPDCNGNGVGDGQDLAQGTSSDCNGNLVPDDCEPDSDGDQIIDDCESPCGAGACGAGAATFAALSLWMLCGMKLARRRRVRR